MKLCKDCKHYMADTAWWGGNVAMATKYAYCERTRPNEIDPVNGARVDIEPRRCSDERVAGWLERFRCGKSGRYWEAK